MASSTNFFVYDSSTSSYIDLSNVLQGYKNGPTSSTNMYFGSIDIGSIFQTYNGTSVQANPTRLYQNSIDLCSLFNKYGTIINNTLNTVTGFTPGVGYMSTIINGIYIIGFFNQYDYYNQDLSGIFTPLNDITNAVVVVVGGGGGGGDNNAIGSSASSGAGGGAGGNVYIGTDVVFNKNTQYILNVGSGGTGGFSNSTSYKAATYPYALNYTSPGGKKGGQSYIGSYYAFGGGGGSPSAMNFPSNGGTAGTGGGNGGGGGTPNNSGGNGSPGTSVVIGSTTYYFSGGGVGGNGNPTGATIPTSGLGGGGMTNASNNGQVYNGLFNIKYNTLNGGGGMGLSFTGGGGQGAKGGSYNPGFPGGSGCVLIAYPVNDRFPVITTDVSYSTCFLNGNILLTITNTTNSSGKISFNSGIRLYNYLVVSGGNAGSNAGTTGAGTTGTIGGPGGLGGTVINNSNTYIINANTNINISVGLGGSIASPSTSSISCSSPSFSTTCTTGTSYGKLATNLSYPDNRGFNGTIWSITNLYYGGGGGPGGNDTNNTLDSHSAGGAGGAGGGGGGGAGLSVMGANRFAAGGYGSDQNGNRFSLNSQPSSSTILNAISLVQGAYITRRGAGGGGGGSYSGGFPNTITCSGGTGYSSIYSGELQSPIGYGSAGTYGKASGTVNGYSGGGGGGASNTGGGGGGGGGILGATNTVFATGGGGGSGVIILYFSVI